jgi:2',3'-cyclic-nucleotide 2'-phosphodiesterase (5'-nucleotidase family)
LYTGEAPSNDVAFDTYPVVIKQGNGKSVPVVQAKSYTKYLGKLHVVFDNEGNLINFDGAPILLNGSVERDEDLLLLLNDFRPRILELEQSVVGETRVKLDGNCRFRECNLGEFNNEILLNNFLNILNNICR